MKQSKPRILILFYSMYGHIFQMANAVAKGVEEEGGKVILKQVAEVLPEEHWAGHTVRKERFKGRNNGEFLGIL